MILTAGPDISQTEIDYVTDAVTNGWNSHWNEYVEKFEKAFSEYVGVRYAITTSGGTGALHLGLAALGIGEGDEVIIPEITYFACADVVKLLGATPVFADIDRDTWTIDPEDMKRRITRKTKAIMPVDLYGNPCDIQAVRTAAGDIPIVEDACPAAGTLYYGKKTGSLADIAAFSFQGAKIMVTGIGGMLVTDNSNLYERALYLNNHGESDKKFWQTAIGYSFEMSNVQAALGLAQLTRLDLFVSKKREIFSWYKEALPEYTLNVEPSYAKTNYWMSSVILPEGVNCGKFRDRLKNEFEIDTRPFFYPMSQFPMYENAYNPVSYDIAPRGVNLPSGLMLDREKVMYVAESVRKLLP